MNLSKPIAATICVFLFGFATYFSYLLVVDELTYFHRGVSTPAVVLEKLKEQTDHREKSYSWHVVYEFEANGRKLQKKDMLDVGRGYDSIEKGDVINVVYDPRNPKTSRTHQAAPVVRYPLIILFIYSMAAMLAYLPIRMLLNSDSDTRFSVPEPFGALQNCQAEYSMSTGHEVSMLPHRMSHGEPPKNSLT